MGHLNLLLGLPLKFIVMVLESMEQVARQLNQYLSDRLGSGSWVILSDLVDPKSDLGSWIDENIGS